MDYSKDTAYVVGGGSRIPNTTDAYGNPVYEPQMYSQSQLNNNMSGNDANAIYYATHDQNVANAYADPFWQNYLGELAAMGLKPNTGQQRFDSNPGSYVTGADAFMMPSSIGTEQVLPRGMGSWEGMPNVPNQQEQARQYMEILNALTQAGAPTMNNNAIREEASLVGRGML